ncbi:hypothetical protein FB559_0251 [Actinoallomurus bryophytorum]|uniref:Uncharacterized protein n=1 Tax=Actinoallomurus bryophytorum TaxID=1490222 RepID=A0A543CCG5_9ACTN|nr:hypothetical protein [Actinoallomurus bryophytorum]TQL94769.1 hypothetical protein FB559_0251 [Actinoallomurus bryophytorum]
MSRDVVAVLDVAQVLLERINVALAAPDRHAINKPCWQWERLVDVRTAVIGLLDPVSGPRMIAENEIAGCTQMLIAAGLELPAPEERTTTHAPIH